MSVITNDSEFRNAIDALSFDRQALGIRCADVAVVRRAWWTVAMRHGWGCSDQLVIASLLFRHAKTADAP